MQKFLFTAAARHFKGVAYDGILAPNLGVVLVLVTDDEFVLPQSDDQVADFVSDVMYFISDRKKSGSSMAPAHVITAERVQVERLVSLMTKTLEES